MSIAVKYLDTRRATIRMLRDYRNQQWKAEYGKEKIKEIQSSLESIPAVVGKTPVSGGGGNRAEETLIAGLDRKALAEKQYCEAVEFMELMEACLSRLSKSERHVLEMRYIDYLEGNGIKRIMDELHISQAVAYRRCDEALNRLRNLLYWQT
jgi:RNA polymerase sigma factor (sigma-70 family)